MNTCKKVLSEVMFEPFPLGSVRPEGWLKQQLRIQADGISGHLDEFWPDVKDSRWLGGNAEAWERAPYWLDGVVPLAYLLDDETLKAKVVRYLDYIITNQGEDGWLGPRNMVVASGHDEAPFYDLWGQILALKPLVQYHDATGDERVVEAVEKNLRCIERSIDRLPLFAWGQFRWYEMLIAIWWLHEKTGDDWLIDLAVKIHAQGFDWGAFFERWPLTEPTEKGRWNFMGHVVNNAQAIKAHGLWWRLTQDERDRAAVSDMIGKLERYHGMVTGVFTGDECIAGRHPTQGTELCAVVEYTYSLEVLLSILGDAAFGDRLERIVFNALPATFSPDMWSHQYDQQVNQVEVSVHEGRDWNTNGPDSNVFGVDPNYGCCTANLSQGWPEFAAHLWMRTQDEGLAVVAYAPSCVSTNLRDIPVRAELETEYPFRDTLRLTIATERAVEFPLLLRIPGWAEGATVRVGDVEAVPAECGTFHRVDQEWQGTTVVELTLPMKPEVLRGCNDTVAIERGPLVYALKIGEEWRRIHEDRPYRELPHADWEIYSTTPWNYALDVDESTLDMDVMFSEAPVGECPFSPDGAPVVAKVKGRRLPEWTMVNGSAGDAPQSPVVSDEPGEELTLIPYGCTNLRVTEFPKLKR